MTVTVIELLIVPVVTTDTLEIMDGSYEMLVSKEITLRPDISVVVIGTVTTELCTAERVGIETTGHGGAATLVGGDVN